MSFALHPFASDLYLQSGTVENCDGLRCVRRKKNSTLRFAVEEGLREIAPLVKLYKRHGTRDCVPSEEKYLVASSPHLQRLILCVYETGVRVGEIKKLTWDKTDFKTSFLRLPAEDTKTNEKLAFRFLSRCEKRLKRAGKNRE